MCVFSKDISINLYLQISASKIVTSNPYFNPTFSFLSQCTQLVKNFLLHLSLIHFWIFYVARSLKNNYPLFFANKSAFVGVYPTPNPPPIKHMVAPLREDLDIINVELQLFDILNTKWIHV